MARFDLTLHQLSVTRSLRVKWLATELGIIDQIKLEDVNLLKGAQFEPEFKKMNKMSAVPVLLLTDKETKDTTYMTESAGICLFLTEQVDGGDKFKPPLTNVLGQAAYYRMIAFAGASMDALLWDIRMHEQLLPEAVRSPMIAKMARKQFLEKVVPTLEEVLGKEDVEYVCEPHCKGFTTADVVVGYACWWATMYGLLAGSTMLQKYLKRVISREHFKSARGNAML